MADYDENHHPAALGDMERTEEKVKHVVLKTLKWGAIGAIGGGLAFAAAPVMLTAAGLSAGGLWTAGALGTSAIVPGGTGILSGLAGWVGGAAVSAGTLGAGVVGGGSAVAGLASGLSTMNGAAEDLNDEKMADFDRQQQRQQRLAALKLQQRQQNVQMAQLEQQYGLPNLQRGREAGIS